MFFRGENRFFNVFIFLLCFYLTKKIIYENENLFLDFISVLLFFCESVFWKTRKNEMLKSNNVSKKQWNIFEKCFIHENHDDHFWREYKESLSQLMNVQHSKNYISSWSTIVVDFCSFLKIVDQVKKSSSKT